LLVVVNKFFHLLIEKHSDSLSPVHLQAHLREELRTGFLESVIILFGLNVGKELATFVCVIEAVSFGDVGGVVLVYK
jgi:hypothetical protein